MATGDTDLFVAKESFATTLDGESVVVQKGITRVRAGHRLLKGREMYFEPLRIHYDVESATAKPGEKRGDPAPTPAPAPAPAPEPVAAAAPSKGLTTDSIKPKTAASDK